VIPLRRVPLSVLELASIGSGSTAREALLAMIELARHVERLGFKRFWLAEHHNMPGIASSAPALLIGQVAAATSSIRVGSGGVMLPNHAPLVVAEQFGTLEALFPGRIDLGLGRAPGTDQATARALRRSADALSAEDFPEQLGELLAFFRGVWPEDHPYANISAVPGHGDGPPIWLLGSSGYSAQVAAALGLPFAFAHHFSAENTLPALELYRKNFRPSKILSAPYAMIAVQVIAAETDARAQYLAGPVALSFLRLREGRPGQLPTPEEAAAFPWSAGQRATVAQRQADQAVGGPETVKRRLAELLEQTKADELMVTTLVHSPADRLKSYELLHGLFA
jgi:luciferase family oxidoreductase group 1